MWKYANRAKGAEKMNHEKKISPVGESWDEYRKKHYTAEEIAENDLMVKKLLVSMGKTLTIVPLELSEK